VDQNEKVKKIVEHYKNTEGALIPILHEVQEAFGYIPKDVQEFIAHELKIPLSEIYGVVTFYSRFSLHPKGKNSVFVCMGTACYVKGAELVLNAVKDDLKIGAGETSSDGLFSIEETRCIGACGLAPIMMINEDVYAKVTPDQIGGILEKYRKEGGAA